jgi:decaprenylphospho-beta-D-ribofuranose 2-oxidase
MNMVKYPEQKISSYGLIEVGAQICAPRSYDEVIECIQYARENGFKICTAGSRLSFSNVCLLEKQISLDMRGFNQLVQLQVAEGDVATATVQAGMLTTHLLAAIIPLGYTLQSLTGSLGNTIGGDIANDVNGKDSWRNGNFGSNVLGLKIATANGEIKDIDRCNHPELFDSIIGGIGLIAIILEARLQLRPIPSFVLEMKSENCRNINDLTEKMNGLNNGQTDFAYCWTDPWAPDNKLGRGIIEAAHFVERKVKISEKELLRSFKQKDKFGVLTPQTFWSIFRKLDFKFTYKYAGFLKLALSRNKLIQVEFPYYQYPMLNYLPEWNLKYYPHGFREWQILIPTTSFPMAYRQILLFCKQRGLIPYVCAVRKHIYQSPYLSFAGDGFSMTVNYGLNDCAFEKLKAFEKDLMDIVIGFYGKVYIGKYPFFKKRLLQKMYPDLNKFLQIKQQYNPNNLFWSDAADMLFKE